MYHEAVVEICVGISNGGSFLSQFKKRADDLTTPKNSNIIVIMSQFYITSAIQQQKMPINDEMIASAMMLMSISENAALNVGYKASSSVLSSCNDSGSNLNGWGSPTTRKSYKVDLCSLGASSESQSMSQYQNQSCGVGQVQEDSSWDYFNDGAISF
jgi:hypothetical protein